MAKAKRTTGAVSFLIILLLGLIVGVYKKCNSGHTALPLRTVTTTPGDWRSHKLIYTKHARCRMACRDITEAEVEGILSTGVVNEQKSQEENEEAEGHCPTYALEGNSADGQHLRIVFGACDKTTKVITAIDLGVEHECNCR